MINNDEVTSTHHYNRVNQLLWYAHWNSVKLSESRVDSDPLFLPRLPCWELPQHSLQKTINCQELRGINVFSQLNSVKIRNKSQITRGTPQVEQRLQSLVSENIKMCCMRYVTTLCFMVYQTKITVNNLTVLKKNKFYICELSFNDYFKIVYFKNK